MQTSLNPAFVSIPDCNAGIKSCISGVRVLYGTMQGVRASGSCSLFAVGGTGRFALLSLSFGGGNKKTNVLFPKHFLETKKKSFVPLLLWVQKESKIGPVVVILLLSFLSIASAGRWEEAPYKEWSEATAAHKAMKNVVHENHPFPTSWRQYKRLLVAEVLCRKTG